MGGVIKMALTPIYGEDPLIAFIGTEPGQLSLEKGHYYSDPRNSFYKDLYASGFLPRVFKPTEDSLLADYNIALDDVCDDPESLHERLEIYRPRSVCFNSKEALCRYLKISNPKSLTKWRGELAGEWASFNWKPLIWALFDSSGKAIQYHKKRVALLKGLYDKLFKQVYWSRELAHFIYADMQVTIRKGSYLRISAASGH
jgi:G:T/U-mismatch repair DNA glycosylase